jgi:hypothetical protein
MTTIRLRSNAFYFKLNEHQRACYNAGLPTNFMGRSIDEAVFSPYVVGDLRKIRSSAHKQKSQLQSFVQSLSNSSNYVASIAIHSAPTDESAFGVASAIFEHAVEGGLACQCISTSQLLNHEKIEPKDVYLIHGVNDQPNPQAVWAVRDFIRDRDGSLRIVVMTSGHDLPVDVLIHERLRMHFDYLFCLEDNVQLISTEAVAGKRMRAIEVGTAAPKPPVARRLVGGKS